MNKSIKDINLKKSDGLSGDMLDITIRKNVKKYLIGGHDRLFGSIIALTRIKIDGNPMLEKYSVLLYYSHETGRIERFIYDTKKQNQKIVFVNDKLNIPESLNNPNNLYVDRMN